MHVPAAARETVDPDTVQAPSAENPTARPELADAETAYVPPTRAGEGGLDVNATVCALRCAAGGVRSGGFGFDVPCGSVKGGAGWSAVATGGSTGCWIEGGWWSSAGVGALVAPGRRPTTRLALPGPPRATASRDGFNPRANAAPVAEPGGGGPPPLSIPSRALWSEIEIPWSPIPPRPGSSARAGMARPSQSAQTRAATSTAPADRSAERTLPERVGCVRRRMLPAIEFLPPQQGIR